MLTVEEMKNVTGTDALPADVAMSTAVLKKPLVRVVGSTVTFTCAAGPAATVAGNAPAVHHEASHDIEVMLNDPPPVF